MNSREIIRQFVNMARHPEAKDYEMAITNELKMPFCIIHLDNGIMYNSDINGEWGINKKRVSGFHNGSRMVGTKFTFDNSRVNKYKHDYKPGYYYDLINEEELVTYNLLPENILGRPITAFDVCWALNKKQSKHYYFATDNGIWAGYGLKDKCEGIIALMVEFKTKESDGTDIFSTEWSDDTSDTIVKLINL